MDTERELYYSTLHLPLKLLVTLVGRAKSPTAPETPKNAPPTGCRL